MEEILKNPIRPPAHDIYICTHAHSGDTGPSALAAVAGKARMRLLVLYPKGRVSPTQVMMPSMHAMTYTTVCCWV